MPSRLLCVVADQRNRHRQRHLSQRHGAPEGYGLNTYVYDNNMISSGVASEVKAAGITVLRYPGGSYSDLYTFISGTDFKMD